VLEEMDRGVKREMGPGKIKVNRSRKNELMIDRIKVRN
jgi:hypothetical protein